MFSPSFRNTPFTGLEWSFKLRDEGFDCEGLTGERIRSLDEIFRGARLNPDGVDEEADENDDDGDDSE